MFNSTGEILNQRDDQFFQSVALPASPGTVYSDAIDLVANPVNPPTVGTVTAADNVQQVELEIVAPALNATEIPSGDTMTYKIQESPTGTGNWTDVCVLSQLTQTGVISSSAGGAASVTQRYRPTADQQRFLRVAATASAGCGNCSSGEFTVDLCF